MRSVRTLLSVLGLILPIVVFAARAPYDIPDQTPADFATVRRQVTEEIPAYLAASQCGGSDMAQSVEGKIATVTGVPGRAGVWDGALLSGMAVRDDIFTYPTEGKGFVTACDSGVTSVEKLVWDEAQHTRVLQTFRHPYFIDPICRWRLKSDFVEQDPPVYSPDDYAEMRTVANPGPPPVFGDKEPLSPPMCTDMCTYLNTWQYRDCLQTVTVLDADGNSIETCPESNWGMRYLCSDFPVGAEDACAPDHAVGLPPQLNPDGSEIPDIGPNARACIGDACRCPGSGCKDSPAGASDGSSPDGRWYLSYFRQYLAAFTRAPVTPPVSNDRASQENIGVACFGYYHEFDPKTYRTGYADRRCVINIDVSDMRNTQQGKGNDGQENALPDVSPVLRDAAYDPEHDLWYENLGAGFSILNEKVFQEEYDGSLSTVYRDAGRLDHAQQHTPAAFTSAGPVAQSGLIRAFDETAEERTLTAWWQKQQMEVSVLLHRPVIRMLLPAGWALGADPFDPLLSSSVATGSALLDRRSERIEVQIDADEDILGEALRVIERSLILRVEEEPVPVVVPLGSPVEFRALAEDWCLWWMRQKNQATCEDAPAEVTQLRTTLLAYADRMEEVRMLRGELARYAGKLLSIQSTLTKPLRDWVHAYIDAYRTILTEQRSIADAVSERWRPVQATMERFQSVTNQPWCMNQRFTLPIYSLLDAWMQTRLSAGSVRNDGGSVLPSLTVPRPEDLFIDLSILSSSTGVLVLPVLKPVQLRITNLPRPPSIISEHGITEPLPQLPPIAPLLLAIRASADALPVPPTAPVLPAPVFPAPLGNALHTEIFSTLDFIGQIVEGMDVRYRLFWESIGPLSPAERDAQTGVVGSHLLRKQNLECMEWDDALCQHTEPDLLERITRIASRPNVLLREDYLSKGPEQVFSTCPPENYVCTPLHPEGATQKQRWEIMGPTERLSIVEEMRSAVRDATLPTPVGGIPIDQMPHYDIDLQELLPIYDVPSPIDLTPLPPSSVSGS